MQITGKKLTEKEDVRMGGKRQAAEIDAEASSRSEKLSSDWLRPKKHKKAEDETISDWLQPKRKGTATVATQQATSKESVCSTRGKRELKEKTPTRKRMATVATQLGTSKASVCSTRAKSEDIEKTPSKAQSAGKKRKKTKRYGIVNFAANPWKYVAKRGGK